MSPIYNPAASVDLTPFDKTDGQTGIYAPSAPFLHNGIAGAALAAGVVNLARFVPSRNMAITKIALSISTAATVDGNVDVGIYNAALNSLLGSSGATGSIINSTGVKTLTLTGTVNLVAGTVYYSAFAHPLSYGGTTPQAHCLVQTSTATDLFGATAGIKEYGAATPVTTVPLPASLTLIGGVSCPVMAVRES